MGKPLRALLLDQISLGHYYFEIGIIMRDSIMVSKIVYNSEVWPTMTIDQYSRLEDCDLMLMRQLLNTCKTVAKESFYITFGKLPLRYIVKTRRLMYLWHILHTDESELIYKCYTSQTILPEKNDWYQQITQDKTDLNIHLQDEDIKQLSKYSFKKYIQDKIEGHCRNYLNKIKYTHSKSNDLPPFSFMAQPYLYSKLFKVKNRMIKVKNNFRNGSEDLRCKTCFILIETQQHLTQCEQIKNRLNGTLNLSEVMYEHRNGTLKEQEKFAKQYTYPEN